MNDILSLLISAFGLGISVSAFIVSYKSSKRITSIEVSNNLMEIEEKIRPGREAMEEIFSEWKRNKRLDFPIKLLEDTSYEGYRKEFIDFYNTNYHHNHKIELNNEKHLLIHRYLSQLDHLWTRLNRSEFGKQEIKERFKNKLIDDYFFIKIYLEAHWLYHKKLDKDVEERFWQNIPGFIEDIRKW